MNFNNVLKNKYLYYVAVALMVINVLGYVALGSIECVLVLGGAAYLANQFTDNRTVDIFIGLFVSNILFGCGRLREGMKNPLEKASDATDKAVSDSNEAISCAVGETRVNGTCTKQTAGDADVKTKIADALANGVGAAKAVDAEHKKKKMRRMQQNVQTEPMHKVIV